MLNRTVFPSGDNFWKSVPGFYPKSIPLRLLDLPAQCSDEEVTNILKLPENTDIINIERLTEKIDDFTFYNGKATATVKVNSKDHEAQLREWSIESHENGKMEWQEIPIRAFIPSLHSCTYCKLNKKPHFGHDVSWCRWAKNAEEQRTKAAEPNIALPKASPVEASQKSVQKPKKKQQKTKETDSEISSSEEKEEISYETKWQTVNSKRKRNNVILDTSQSGDEREKVTKKKRSKNINGHVPLNINFSKNFSKRYLKRK